MDRKPLGKKGELLPVANVGYCTGNVRRAGGNIGGAHYEGMVLSSVSGPFCCFRVEKSVGSSVE